MQIHVGAARPRSRSGAPWLIGGILVGFALFVGILWCVAILPGFVAYYRYKPQEGDVIFQSLPYSRLVNAIEGATRSPFSHCGIVAKENGRWVVYEALEPIGATPLGKFISRGRGGAFEVYRLRNEFQQHIPQTLANVRKYRGRPYDERYRLDDNGEAIYCSELIYLAYQEATGEPLGKLVALRDLKWEPYAKLIERIDNGPPPLDRQIITPRDLAKAKQLEKVYSFGFSPN
jgi:hypothetical protein